MQRASSASGATLAGHRPRRPGPAHWQAPQPHRHGPHQARGPGLRARLLTQVDEGRRPATDVTLAQLLERWLEMADLAWSTRVTYKGYIERTILPTLGQLPLRRLDTATLDRFYRGGLAASGDGLCG